MNEIHVSVGWEIQHNNLDGTHMNLNTGTEARQNRSICLPFTDRDNYIGAVKNPGKFRAAIDSIAKQRPELLPSEIIAGYLMKDIRNAPLSFLNTIFSRL